MADKLEKETKAHESATKRIEELSSQINDLNNKVCFSVINCKIKVQSFTMD